MPTDPLRHLITAATRAAETAPDPQDPKLSGYRLTAEDALTLAARGEALLVDIRKAPARALSGRGLINAPWADPAAFDAACRHALLRQAGQRFLIMTCVHGHEVSQSACEILRAEDGAHAYFVSGGFGALEVAGAPIEALGGGAEDSSNGGTGR